MKIWKIGIIGAGLIADFHAKAIMSLENARLAGISGTNHQKAKSLSEKYGCRLFDSEEDMLSSDEVDIVTIATPSGAHMEPVLLAARYGKHAICEKPLEISLERIDRMILAHESAGTRLGGIFNIRFNETTDIIKKAIADDRFGTITYASVHVPWWRTDAYYANSWHGTQNMDGGGALMNQAIHMIDLLQYMMGPVESLQAYVATIGHKIETEDTGVAALKFKNNALGFIYGTTASFPGQFKRLEITGTKGTVILVENSLQVWQFADHSDQDNEIIQRFSMIQGGGGVSDPGAIPFEPHARNISAFIESVESGNPFSVDAKEARKAVEIITGIYASSREMKPYFFK